MWCCPMSLPKLIRRGNVPVTWARLGQENLPLPQRRLYASREWARESGLGAQDSVASRILWRQKPTIYLPSKQVPWKRQGTEPSERVNKHGRVHHNLDLVHYTTLTSAASSRFHSNIQAGPSSCRVYTSRNIFDLVMKDGLRQEEDAKNIYSGNY